MAKIKLGSIVAEIAGEALREAIKTAKPKYKDLTDEQLAEVFGLTPYQFEHLADKALGRAVDEKLEEAIKETLKRGDSIEVPHQFNVYVHESKARKNENGTPAKKLSIRTRRETKAALNN